MNHLNLCSGVQRPNSNERARIKHLPGSFSIISMFEFNRFPLVKTTWNSHHGGSSP